MRTSDSRWFLVLLMAGSLGLTACGGGDDGGDDGAGNDNGNDVGGGDDGGDAGDSGGDTGGTKVLTSENAEEVAVLALGAGVASRDGMLSAADGLGGQTRSAGQKAAQVLDCPGGGRFSMDYSDSFTSGGGSSVPAGAWFEMSYSYCQSFGQVDQQGRRIDGTMRFTFTEPFQQPQGTSDWSMVFRLDYDEFAQYRNSDNRLEAWIDGAQQADFHYDYGSDSSEIRVWPGIAGVSGGDTIRADVTDVDGTPLELKSRNSEGELHHVRLEEADVFYQFAGNNAGLDVLYWDADYVMQALAPDWGRLDVETTQPFVWTIDPNTGQLDGLQGELRVDGPQGGVVTVRALGAEAEVIADGETRRIGWEEFDEL